MGTAVYRLPESWAGRFSFPVPVELLVLLEPKARGGDAFAWDGRCCSSRFFLSIPGTSRGLLTSPPGQSRRVILRLCEWRFRGVHYNGIVNVGGAGGVSSSGPPDFARSVRYKGVAASRVAAAEPCGGDPSPSGSSAAGVTSVAGEKRLASR